MHNMIKIGINTLTPIWTGGVEGRCDRLSETGIIGSMRWWYEVIVRGLGGYACDPTSDKRCILTGKEKSDHERKKNMCPVCYLFGCGGWKRQFQLFSENATTTPLHFRTSTEMNKKWLKNIFGGQSQDIDKMEVFYKKIEFRFMLRETNTRDDDYIKSQLLLLLMAISKYGGLGAKLQHGFGQINVMMKEQVNENEVIKTGLKELSKRIQNKEFYYQESRDIVYNLKNFVKLEYDLSASFLKEYKSKGYHIGNYSKIKEDRYIPCAFDLRYKGLGKFGMRKWLKEIKGWPESDDPKKLDKLDQLLGPRAQWKHNGQTIKIEESKRTASRLYFGMPYKLSEDKYRLRIFGFAPPDILSPEDLKRLCNEYMEYVFGEGASSPNISLGKEIMNIIGGDSDACGLVFESK